MNRFIKERMEKIEMNRFVKRLTVNVPQEIWIKIKQLKKKKNKNYKEIILEAVNVLFETNNEITERR